MPSARQHETMDLTVGDKVCVLPGRHFQDFAAGDSGVVSMVDRKAQTCQVYFDHRLGSEPLNVAFRNLSRVDGGGSGSSWPRAEVLPLAEAEDERPRRKAERELDVAPVLGSALGALASAGYWEGALAHLGSTPSPACPSGAGQQAQQDCEGCGLDMQEDVSSLLEHKKHTEGEKTGKGCVVTGKYHYPVMPGMRIEVSEWQHCQSYCRVTEGCQFFSFWPDSGCELQSGPGEYRTATSAYSGVISGPANCADDPPGAINLLDMSFMYCAAHPDAKCCKCGTCCLPYCDNAKWTLREGCNYEVTGWCHPSFPPPVCFD
ncbi:hypothetical protein AK812_SmicGene5977 [Symbiodinium microadriaticum]|uniref:Apple domain-containing protein n=1 Tax=Symbiodinium microadriaticum TaxID=2951 RepID=A0A1Q9ES49_SYMMI|nr:hypothetical protein AK812_SmicGene5977 [Symbiodinium microadriaticum]